jgi:signal peptidase
MNALSAHNEGNARTNRAFAVLARACSRASSVADRVVDAVALLASAMLAVAVLLFAAVGIARAFEYHALTVMSGSMEPTLHVGDLVIERRVSPLDLHAGDVVTFRDPDENARLLTHRVFRFRARGAKAYVVTKGDANRTVERWSIPTEGTLGRVEFRVPKIGYAVMSAGGRFGRLALVAIPALLLGLFELRRIWSPKEDAGDA